jgi:hypothetical protein
MPCRIVECNPLTLSALCSWLATSPGLLQGSGSVVLPSHQVLGNQFSPRYVRWCLHLGNCCIIHLLTSHNLSISDVSCGVSTCAPPTMPTRRSVSGGKVPALPRPLLKTAAGLLSTASSMCLEWEDCFIGCTIVATHCMRGNSGGMAHLLGARELLASFLVRCLRKPLSLPALTRPGLPQVDYRTTRSMSSHDTTRSSYVRCLVAVWHSASACK